MRPPFQITLRIADTVINAITELAKLHNRSINAEINSLLESALNQLETDEQKCSKIIELAESLKGSVTYSHH